MIIFFIWQAFIYYKQGAKTCMYRNTKTSLAMNKVSLQKLHGRTVDKQMQRGELLN